MFFDDRNTFENWAETLPAYDTHDRHGCACCSALPSLLAEQFDDIEQLTQPEHWAARGQQPSKVINGHIPVCNTGINWIPVAGIKSFS